MPRSIWDRYGFEMSASLASSRMESRATRRWPLMNSPRAFAAASLAASVAFVAASFAALVAVVAASLAASAAFVVYFLVPLLQDTFDWI